ncbi:MAG TPA: murein biosynthesis integral membrane protein MurJ, partial [Gemmatimonadales bacterium]|nr:murein biosynthesis integral membrane protein MurJ [Gemmatimonadales bacterium]
NLFGEGALSAAFIPVYARRLGANDLESARRVAGAVLSWLALILSVVVLVGVTAAPLLVDILAPGFQGSTRTLTITLVRLLFPGAGLLVFSAWCLGILNSHRRFFLSYAAPVAWNIAIIVTLLVAGPRVTPARLTMLAAMASVAGSLLQFLVQLPVALRLSGGVPLGLSRKDPHVREVGRTFGPALLSRGVAQLSAFIDSMIASLLPTGAVAALANAQLLYSLPVSLFGMSIAAAELPAMASETGSGEDVTAALQARLTRAMSRVAFFVVPSAAAFISLGHMVAGLVYQSGRFDADDARYVWAVLAASSVGLLAAALARLFGSAFFALGDTRTPFRCAATRMLVGSTAGFLAARFLPGLLGLEPRWGLAGLTLASGTAGWVEFVLLRRALRKRIGVVELPRARLVRLWVGAALGAAAGWGTLSLLRAFPLPVQAIASLGAFGVVYLLVCRKP